MIKTVLLIGKTGSGKSTLANVISGTNKFKESGSSISATKDIQSEEFEENNINYRIIDTVGIGDTKLTKNEVLDKIAEAVYLARDGVSQVLFVNDGRFDQFETTTYNLLRTIIFDKHIANHTTIVRTCFENFREKEECKKNIDLMINKDQRLAEIIKSCQRKVVHVDNSPIPMMKEGDSESEKKRKEKKLRISTEKRIDSRKTLSEHLSKNCQGTCYRPPKLGKLSKVIVNYMEENLKKKEELENENQNFTKAAHERKKSFGRTWKNKKKQLVIKILKKLKAIRIITPWKLVKLSWISKGKSK